MLCRLFLIVNICKECSFRRFLILWSMIPHWNVNITWPATVTVALAPPHYYYYYYYYYTVWILLVQLVPKPDLATLSWSFKTASLWVALQDVQRPDIFADVVTNYFCILSWSMYMYINVIIPQRNFEHKSTVTVIVHNSDRYEKETSYLDLTLKTTKNQQNPPTWIWWCSH